MPLAKGVLELMEKSSPKCKEAFANARKSLAAVKSEMGEEQWKAFQKAFAFEGKETPAEEDAEKEATKKSLTETAAQLAAGREAIKKSIGMLDVATPDVIGAVNTLAPLVGVTPVNAQIAKLPPEVQAHIESLQKSAADNKSQLDAMQKSLADGAAAQRKAELVAKSAKDFSHVPGASTDELAVLQMGVNDAAAPILRKVLESTEAIVAKSSLLDERGSNAGRIAGEGGGHAPVVGGSGAYGKICELAGQLVQKSSGTLTDAQARAQVLATPEGQKLYAEHMNEREAAARR